jgi:hypothetical protein
MSQSEADEGILQTMLLEQEYMHKVRIADTPVATSKEMLALVQREGQVLKALTEGKPATEQKRMEKIVQSLLRAKDAHIQGIAFRQARHNVSEKMREGSTETKDEEQKRKSNASDLTLAVYDPWGEWRDAETDAILSHEWDAKKIHAAMAQHNKTAQMSKAEQVENTKLWEGRFGQTLEHFPRELRRLVSDYLAWLPQFESGKTGMQQKHPSIIRGVLNTYYPHHTYYGPLTNSRKTLTVTETDTSGDVVPQPNESWKLTIKTAVSAVSMNVMSWEVRQLEVKDGKTDKIMFCLTYEFNGIVLWNGEGTTTVEPAAKISECTLAFSNGLFTLTSGTARAPLLVFPGESTGLFRITLGECFNEHSGIQTATLSRF